jgi:simple sugar transport system ATP-binding protein
MTAMTNSVTEESLARAMLGQQSHQSSAPSHSVTTPTVDTPVIQLENASIDGALSGRALTSVNLEIKRGEIIGIAALDGAAADLLRVLARRANARAGNLKLPPDAGFIPEDRHRDAMISEFRLFENVALRDSGFRRGHLAWAGFRARTNSILNRFDVRAQSIEMRAGALSGGNQQKLVLGRELDDDPDVLVAENPTRGLDILATENIKQHLRAAAERGCAIVFYSSDIEEIIELANRTFVVRDGALIPVERSEEAIGYALLRS